jgi:hypothetical protein
MAPALQPPELSARAVLEQHLAREGWKAVRRRSKNVAHEQVFERDGRKLVVDAQSVLGPVRRDALLGALAQAILGSRAAANALAAEPLALVHVARLSAASLDHLHAFVARVAPDQAWAAVDDDGRLELHGRDLPHSIAPRRQRSRRPENRRARQRGLDAPHKDPFSDLGQRMLKVILARDLPEGLLNAPREEIHSVSDLARAAGVSLASASRQIAALEAEEFVDWDANGLHVVRRESLFERWAAVALRPQRQSRARLLLPSKDPLAAIAKEVERRRSERSSASGAVRPASAELEPQFCIGWYSACRRLGFGHVLGMPPHLYCEKIGAASLSALGLYAVAANEPFDVIVVEPNAPQSVFMSAVRQEPLPVADILQCWLDVRAHPARGQEQAEELVARLPGVFSRD